MKFHLQTLVAAVVLCTAARSFGQPVIMSLSGGSGAPGTAVKLSISLTPPASARVSAIQWTFTYSNRDISSVSVTLAPSGSGAGKSIWCNPDPGRYTCIVAGKNANPLPVGVIANALVQLSSSTLSSSALLQVSGGRAASANGSAQSLQAANVSISIVHPLQSAPVPRSVTPSGGTSSAQVFQAVASHSAGPGQIDAIYLLVNDSIDPKNACYLVYYPAQNTVFLMNDAATGWLGPLVVGRNGSLANTQCTLNGAGTRSQESGTTVILTLALYFKPPFGGARTLYLRAANGSAYSGWQAAAWWNVPSVIAAVSSTPNSGRGSSQVFVFTFYNPYGGANLTDIYAQIDTYVKSQQGCYVMFNYPRRQFLLMNDAGTIGLGPANAGSNSRLSNSHCTLNAAASSVRVQGNYLYLTVALQFAHSYAGVKDINLLASNDRINSGWQQRGTWVIP